MNSNLTDKNIAPYKKFLSTRKILIVSDSGITRSAIRGFLKKIGVNGSSIFQSENISDAKQQIKNLSPKIVFVNYRIGNKKGIDLIDLLRDLIPSGLETVFSVISDFECSGISAEVVERDVDILLVKPFSIDDAERKFIKIVTNKALARPFEIAIDDIEVSFRNDDDNVLKKIDKLLGQKESDFADFNNESKSLVHSYRGEILNKLGKIEESKKAFETAVFFDQSNYKALSSFFKMLFERREFEEAYDLVHPLLGGDRLSPKLLTDLLDVILVCKKYEDIKNYYDIFSHTDNEFPDLPVNFPKVLLGAGKYFIEKLEYEYALFFLKKSISLSHGSIEIIEDCLDLLSDIGAMREVKKVFLKIPATLMTPRLKIIDLLLKDDDSDLRPAKILEFGMSLLNHGIKDPRVYEIVIKHSMKIERGRDIIEELRSDAIKLFPEKKDFFKKLVKS